MTKKSLARNSFYNVIYKSLNVVFPLFTTMYISRILLPAGVGRVAAAQNVATYFTLIVTLGLPTYGVKLIAEKKDDPESVSKGFSELFTINLISTIICSVAYYSLLFSMDTFKNELNLYVILGLPIILNVFNIDWFYQGIEEYKYIMNRSLLVKSVCFALMVALIRSPEDYLLYAFLLSAGTVLNYAFNVLNLKGRVRFRMHGLKLRPHLKAVFMLLAASLAIEIYSLMGVTILNLLCGEEAVAYYSNSLKGVKIIKNFITSICTAFLPRMAYYYLNGRFSEFEKLSVRGIKILLYFAVPASLGCIAISESLVEVLFGTEFMPASMTIKILAPTITTIAISNFVGYQVLIVAGRERNMLIATGCGAVINIILNFALIPDFRHNGAALATLITEGIVAVMQYSAMEKYLKVSVEWKYWQNMVLNGLILFVIAFLCHRFGQNALLKCALTGMVGIGTYALSTIISKNEISIVVLDKIKGHFVRK